MSPTHRPLRVQDVALLAVDVVQKGDAGRAVGVVLNGSDLGGHAVLVALEVDDAVTTLGAAALVTRGDAPVVVAAALLVQRRKQGLLRLVRRDLGEVRDRLEASAGAGRLVLFDSHVFPFCGFSLARLSVHRKPNASSWARLPPRTLGRLGPRDSDAPRVRVYPSVSRRKRELYAVGNGDSRKNIRGRDWTQPEHKWEAGGGVGRAAGWGRGGPGGVRLAGGRGGPPCFGRKSRPMALRSARRGLARRAGTTRAVGGSTDSERVMDKTGPGPHGLGQNRPDSGPSRGDAREGRAFPQAGGLRF